MPIEWNEFEDMVNSYEDAMARLQALASERKPADREEYRSGLS